MTNKDEQELLEKYTANLEHDIEETKRSLFFLGIIAMVNIIVLIVMWLYFYGV